MQEFRTFIESLERYSNKSLIESILTGYDALFEVSVPRNNVLIEANIKLYHASDRVINTFTTNRNTYRFYNGAFGGSSTVKSQGIFFTDDIDVASAYGDVISLYDVKINKLLDIRKFSTEDEYKLVEYICEPLIKDNIVQITDHEIDIRDYIDERDDYDDDMWGGDVVPHWSIFDNPEVVSRIKKLGYDAAIVLEAQDEMLGDELSYIVFNPSNITLIDSDITNEFDD